MSGDGPTKGAGCILAGLVSALLGAAVCTVLSAYPVSFCMAVPPSASLEVLLIAGLCYFAGFAGLIFLKSLTALKYGLVAGLTITLGILAWNGIASLANVLAVLSLDMTATMVLVGAVSILTYIVLAQKHGSELAPSPALTAGIQHSNSVMNTKDCLRALEVVQYPSDYLSSSD